MKWKPAATTPQHHQRNHQQHRQLSYPKPSTQLSQRIGFAWKGFRRNGLAYFKLYGDVKHGYTMDGYGAVNYWHRDSEGHLTHTPVEGKLIHKLRVDGPGWWWELVPVDTDYDDRGFAF